MNNLSLKQTLSLIIGMLAVVALASVGMILFSESRLASHSESLVNHEVMMLDEAHSLKLSVIQVQQWLTDISATRGQDGLNDGFDEAEANAKKFYDLIARLEETDPQNKARYEAMKPAFAKYYEVGRKMAQAYIDEGPDGGNKMMAHFDEAAAALSEQIEPFLEQVRQQVAIKSEESLSLLGSLKAYTIAGAVLFLLVLGVLALLFKSIQATIGLDPKALSELARDIANGHLNKQIRHQGPAEGVFKALLEMRDKLRTQIENINLQAIENGRMRSALDNAAVNITVSGEDNNLIYMNKKAVALFEQLQSTIQQKHPGYKSSELIGKSVSEYFDDPELITSYRKKLTSDTRFETRFGNFELELIASPVYDNDGNYIGRVTQWNDRTEELTTARKEQQRIEQERKVAAENARIRIALDNVNSNVMLANSEREIIYLNKAAQSLFSDIESDIRKELPNFNAAGLVGVNIDAFHKNPSHQINLLASLKGKHESEFVIGGRTMHFIANSVSDADGNRLGTAVEWVDRTVEVGVEKEIDALVESASMGDISKRIDMHNKSGFYKQLGIGFNELLNQLSNVFEDIAEVMQQMAEGNVTQTINKDYQGVFGKVSNAINSTISNIRNTITDIRSMSEQINHSSGEINSANINLSSRTEQQASSLEETAASMEQLLSTVRNNTDNANTANTMATSAKQEATVGGNVVSQAVEAMQAINRSSQEIGEIIGVIDEIAFQTNLLALNASVEAARAGEQGRGFAVVATEVRNLASRSAEAAREIKELIKDSEQKVLAGSELVNQSGEKLNSIVASVTKVGDLVSEMAAASSEQMAGIEQVNQAVSSLDEITQQNAALAEETSAASAEMSTQSQKMQQAVDFFKLG